MKTTNEYRIDVTDFITNIDEMTFDELKSTCGIITTMYVEFDKQNENYYGIHEYFRTQIDIIENYCMNKFGRSTFDNVQ